jgi:hypothetical protein
MKTALNPNTGSAGHLAFRLADHAAAREITRTRNGGQRPGEMSPRLRTPQRPMPHHIESDMIAVALVALLNLVAIYLFWAKCAGVWPFR